MLPRSQMRLTRIRQASVSRRIRRLVIHASAGDQPSHVKRCMTDSCPWDRRPECQPRVGLLISPRVQPVVRGRTEVTGRRVPGPEGEAVVRGANRRMTGDDRRRRSGCRPRLTQFSLQESIGGHRCRTARGRQESQDFPSSTVSATAAVRQRRRSLPCVGTQLPDTARKRLRARPPAVVRAPSTRCSSHHATSAISATAQNQRTPSGSASSLKS
jgi:hypothetical protein